jgi:hypothetical protein
VLIAFYYSFTSLSTVGFGDYHPKSNAERIFCAVVLVSGVIIFSVVMGTFIEMIQVYNILNEDIDESDDLTRFFGLIKKYNNNRDID